MSELIPYYGEWSSCDGLYDGEVRSTKPDDPWPAMVQIEFGYGNTAFGATLTVEDAEELAAYIGAAACLAKYENRVARASRDGESA